MTTARMWRTPGVVLFSGALALSLSLGIRHAFGLFLQPMSVDLGWGREAFALAIATQNLIWGLAQPFAGRLADRHGAGWIVLSGALLYVTGLYLMSLAATEWSLLISAGLLIGVGLSGTTFPVVFGVISRVVAPEKRSWAMGVSMSIGSLGQFLLLPGSNVMIAELGWSHALLVLAGLSVLMLPLSAALMEPGQGAKHSAMPLRAVLAEAVTHRGFWLLSFGFFVCGFQVIFISTHLPAFLVDQGLALSSGATVLALIGLFNIAGSFLAGFWGGHFPKPLLLSGIYAARLIVIALFIGFPVTTWSACAFGVAMGLLWLSTVPLTNGVVATLFGVENLSMLGGIVFLFHQMGAFLGGWLGGYLYDLAGNYDRVWMIAIALSVIAGLLNLPIRERSVPRLVRAGA
ncbi:MAG: MFS transporter [Candidatus Competibacteraceae bacterium]|nr:MFS transporter [Candidatus Competibacteraceae bacterium]MCP5127420.1 MFS transporter [Gammaproteobacteria bacterium]